MKRTFNLNDRVYVDFYGREYQGSIESMRLRDHELATVVGFRMDEAFYVIQFDSDGDISTYHKTYLKRADSENDIMKDLCSR